VQVVVVVQQVVVEPAADFEQIAVELVVIERVAELAQVVAEQVEQVVGLNSDLFGFLPFLFYSRK
jgi:hypothetical protein